MADTKTTGPEPTMKFGDAPKSLWVGLIAGLLGFVLSFSFSSSSTINGVVASCSSFDLGALIAAVVCFACAVRAVSARRKLPYQYPIRIEVVYVLSAVTVLLGVIHVLRAFGILGGAC